MKLIKSVILFIFMFFVAMPSYSASAVNSATPTLDKNIVYKKFDVETDDGFILKAYLSYPKTRLHKYPVVILLHSLGDNYTSFSHFEKRLNYAGFAVLGMDLRGHGRSVYTKNLKQRAWQYFKYDTYALYPTDVLSVMKFIQSKYKKIDFSNYAIVGGDIGANTAVLVAKTLPIKPKALILFSPMMKFKGLYIPVAMTEIGLTPILALASETDKTSMTEQMRLAKFAQGNFDVINTPKGGAGISLLKSYPELEYQLTLWLIPFFKGQLTAITPESIAAAKAIAAAEKAAKAAKAAKAKAAREAKLHTKK